MKKTLYCFANTSKIQKPKNIYDVIIHQKNFYFCYAYMSDFYLNNLTKLWYPIDNRWSSLAMDKEELILKKINLKSAIFPHLIYENENIPICEINNVKIHYNKYVGCFKFTTNHKTIKKLIQRQKYLNKGKTCNKCIHQYKYLITGECNKLFSPDIKI